MKTALFLLLGCFGNFLGGYAADTPSKIAVTVKSLGPGTKPDDLAQLRADPLEAIKLVVQQLAPVSERKILTQNQSFHPTEMRVIWSIRALRYLSGTNSTGKTKHRFSDSETDRSQFLNVTDNNEVSFFGTWMSRDSIYIAPRDAQAEIIERWKKWAKSDAKNHKFVTPKDMNEWYP